MALSAVQQPQRLLKIRWGMYTFATNLLDDASFNICRPFATCFFSENLSFSLEGAHRGLQATLRSIQSVWGSSILPNLHCFCSTSASASNTASRQFIEIPSCKVPPLLWQLASWVCSHGGHRAHLLPLSASVCKSAVFWAKSRPLMVISSCWPFKQIIFGWKTVKAMRYFDCANSGIPSNLALELKKWATARPNVFHAQLVAPTPLRSTCNSEIL